MAATLTEKWAIPIGQSRVLCHGTILLDSSYPTGGEAIDATGDGYEFLLIDANTGHKLQFDKANQKVMAFYADYDAVADGALIQVPNATDLSAVTGSYLAVRAT